MKKTHYRTLWLSDIHLGNRDCKAEYLLSFLNSVTVDTLYLVGDIVDMWQMTKQFRWPQAHNQVMHKLMAMSQDGTRVVYLPGNHDEPIQSYSGMAFGDIEIERQLVHTTAQGKRYLVLHGDQFDGDVTMGKFHAWIGDKGYDLLLFLNRWTNRIRKAFGGNYYSLAAYIKARVHKAQAAITAFEDAAIHEAKKQKVDGIICGHIHHPKIKVEDGIVYCNDGDWIESCTALVEQKNGKIELLHWSDTQKVLQSAEVNNTATLVKPNKSAA